MDADRAGTRGGDGGHPPTGDAEHAASGVTVPNDSEVAAVPSPIGRVVTKLQADAPRLVANWAIRVANLPAFRATPELNLVDLRDAMPEILTAALTAMAAADVDLDPEPVERACAAAATHGAARARGGFGIGAVLEEYHQLRSVVWAAIWRMVDQEPGLESVVREAQPRVSRAFGDVTVAAAEAWAAAGHASATTA